MDATTFLENWYNRVWTDQDLEAIDELFAPEHGAPELASHGPIELDTFKMFHSALTNILSDIKVSVDRVFENGPWVSAMVTIRAISRETGKPVEVTSGSFARIENGQIREGYDHINFLSLWIQMGYLPENIFELGLQGKRL